MNPEEVNKGGEEMEGYSTEEERSARWTKVLDANGKNEKMHNSCVSITPPLAQSKLRMEKQTPRKFWR